MISIRSVFLLLLGFSTVLAYGQKSMIHLNYGGGGSKYILNFDSDSSRQYISKDTTNGNNIWQIGQPQKTFFDSAYSSPNAILTDTISAYPNNDSSSFQIKVKGYTKASPMKLSFLHRFETDTFRDGGYIDVSYNGGKSWNNIINDTSYLGIGVNSYNFYDSTDTIINGVPAFTGKQDWVKSTFEWQHCLGVKKEPNDSVIIRFNFKSDSVQNNNEGWIIDNLIVQMDGCSGINENPTSEEVKIYPNPVYKTSKVKLTNNFEKGSMEVYNTLGRKVLDKPIHKRRLTIKNSNFNAGLYYYIIYNEGVSYSTGKFIVR